MVLGVGSYHRLGSAGVDLAVAGDVIMIANGQKAAGLVAGFEGLNTEAAVCPGGGAVDDDVGDLSHDCLEDYWIFIIFACGFSLWALRLSCS